MSQKSSYFAKNLIHSHCILLSVLSCFGEYFGSLRLYLHCFMFGNHIQHKKCILIDFGKVISLVYTTEVFGKMLTHI